MNHFIARGYNSWTYATNSEDALVRLLCAVGNSRPIDLDRIRICEVSDDWSICTMTGELIATELTVLPRVDKADVEEALVTLVDQAVTLATVAGRNRVSRRLEDLQEDCYS